MREKGKCYGLARDIGSLHDARLLELDSKVKSKIESDRRELYMATQLHPPPAGA